MIQQEETSRFVTAAFAEWNKAGIDWLVLRNYEGLPHSTTNDIDVLVRPEQMKQAEAALLTAAGNSGFRRNNRAEFATLASFFFHPGSGAQVHFDLFRDLKWRSFDFLDCDCFFQKKVSRDLFSVPHPAHEAATSLLATLIYTGKVKEKYKPLMQAGFSSQAAEAMRLLALTYGATSAKFMVEAGTKENWGDLEAATAGLRRAMTLRQMFGRPFRTAGSILRDIKRVLIRILRPPGVSVVLCGADGSGKSTVAAAIIERLGSTFPGAKVRQFHWKPPVFSGARQAARGPTDDPHSKPPRNILFSLIYFGMHWLEFFLGALVKIRPATFRGGLVLIDRYYYDFFVDQRRYRLKVPQWIVQLGLRLLKKPDLVVLLDAPVETLRRRKQETSLEETTRQREAYLAMVRGLKNGVVINAAQPPEKVAGDISKAVLEFMAERQARRGG